MYIILKYFMCNQNANIGLVMIYGRISILVIASGNLSFSSVHSARHSLVKSWDSWDSQPYGPLLDLPHEKRLLSLGQEYNVFCGVFHVIRIKRTFCINSLKNISRIIDPTTSERNTATLKEMAYDS
jgi:hypothetical protein